LAELGADVVKVEPPGGEGGFQLMPVLPNIYVDANRSKRGLTLDLRAEEDRERLLDLVGAADVVVENAVAGTWERLGLSEGALREMNPNLVYARAKGFGMDGPLAPRPSFDYVVQAATGMEMTQGGGRPQPVNFTANDYGTGLHMAVGVVLALLARARGAQGGTVDASLMVTSTVFQSEHVAQIALYGKQLDDVGSDLRGPSPGCHIYRALDGWVALCAVTPAQQASLRDCLGVDHHSVEAIGAVVATMSHHAVRARLEAAAIPVALSVHPNAVADDPQVIECGLLSTTHHRAAGRFIQVGIPLHLSIDRPAVRGPAPSPAPRRARTVQPT